MNRYRDEQANIVPPAINDGDAVEYRPAWINVSILVVKDP